jgi:PAS domain S-box-containing protein
VIYSRDPRAGFALTFVSDNAAQVLGYDAGRLLGEEGLWNAIVHPADAGRVHEGLARAGGRGEQSLEYRVFRADGSCRWVRDEWRPVRDAAGHLVEIVGSLVDVTERKHGEDERARLSSAVEQASDCIVITNPDGTIVYVNPAFERATGFGQAEAIGRNPRLVKSGQHPPEFYGQMWATLVRGEPWSGFLVNKRRDGTLYEAEAIIFPVRDAAGRLVNYVGVLRDVTRERRIEEQLRQSQKMEAVGRLAGGVAHDFNNLLTIISGRAELLLQRLGRDNPLSHELDLVLKTSHRAAALTRQLLAFSRKQVLSMQVLDVNAVVINIERMLRRLIGEDIELATALDPGLGRVKADPGQLEQVIMNLAVNARDAMPRGGHLRIETGNVDPAGGGLPTGAAPGPHVLLSVSDDGCGMDRDTRARIFEPFFTTKDVNAGTGLGLATVYGIVKQSGGDIAVDSEPGQGTRFRIYLPRVEEPASSARPGAPGAARGGRETILLVEDEPDVRSLAREFLESAGYSVLEATGGGEALSIAGEHAGPIDLVITDVVMPEIDGRKLIERLRGLRPDTKSLYMSGYTDDAILRYGVLTAEMALLQKPFTAEALIRKVRALLDAGPAPVGAGARPAAGGA